MRPQLTSRPARAQAPASPAPAQLTGHTPLVQRLAAQHGVALAGLQGTGAGGRVCTRDVLAAADAQAKDRASVDTSGADIRASALYRGVPGWGDGAGQ